MLELQKKDKWQGDQEKKKFTWREIKVYTNKGLDGDKEKELDRGQWVLTPWTEESRILRFQKKRE